MMKKNFFYAMMSAIALTGAMGFTACTSDEDVAVENNPTYDDVAKTVTAQFVLNVSSQLTLVCLQPPFSRTLTSVVCRMPS